MSLSPGFLLSCPVGLAPGTEGSGSQKGNKPPRGAPVSTDRHTPRLPSALTPRSRPWWAGPPAPQGHPGHQAGPWALNLVFKSSTQMTTTESLRLLCPPSGLRGTPAGPARLRGRAGSGRPSGLEFNEKWQRAPETSGLGEGRVHGNPPTGQSDRPTPTSGSQLKNSLEMHQGLKEANDIKIVSVALGERSAERPAPLTSRGSLARWSSGPPGRKGGWQQLGQPRGPARGHLARQAARSPAPPGRGWPGPEASNNTLRRQPPTG